MANLTKIEGDTFVLCTFPLMFAGQPYVLDSGNSAEEVCKSIPRYLLEEDETLCFCRVDHWVFNGDEMEPRGVTTIFQIDPYEPSALEDEDEED